MRDLAAAVEVLPLRRKDVGLVWPLVRQVAARELSFPPGALRHFKVFLDAGRISSQLRRRDGVILGARRGVELVGVLVGAKPEGGVGTIVWCIIGPAAQGLGIGRRLFDKGCRCFAALGCHKVKLTATSPRAVRFYEKCGMKVEGFHKSHWWGLDFWSLGKLL